MAEALAVNAKVRNGAGKGAARAQRRAGLVPAVIYGNKEEPVMVSLEIKDVDKLIKSPQFFTQIFEVQVGENSHPALAREVQLHPVTDRPIHIDFLRFDENTRITFSIPAVFINEEQSPGLKRGGVLNIVRREIEVLCSPVNIPSELVFDLEGLDIGDAIHIGVIELPEGVSTVTDRDFTVATIAAPTLMPTEEEESEEELEEGEGEDILDGDEDGDVETSGGTPDKPGDGEAGDGAD